MANIDTLLQAIMDAVYGEEVRGSIHDAIYEMNQESSAAMQYAATAQDSAQRAATTATNKAGEATGAATTATTAAGEATGAATTATTAAGEATGAATVATTAAGEATDAATVATTAAGEATTAQDSAQRAATTATNKAAEARFYSGKPPKPQNGTWWIWSVEVDPPAYVDTHISCELEGPQGIGISNIQHTSGNHSPGTSDVYTITLTNGSTYTISVWNGRNGEGTGDVLGSSFDLSIPVSGWSNKVATISDNRFIAQSKYRYFLIAVESSRSEFLECKVSVSDITTNGFIVFTCETVPTHELTVNITRMELSENS